MSRWNNFILVVFYCFICVLVWEYFLSVIRSSWTGSLHAKRRVARCYAILLSAIKIADKTARSL